MTGRRGLLALLLGLALLAPACAQQITLNGPAPAPITASLGADVALNNVTTLFDGPTIAQGTAGTWWVSGKVTLQDTAGANTIWCELWDGATAIDSGSVVIAAANGISAMALSGYLASPAGNLKISCKDTGSTSGKIVFNASGNSKDSTISAFRIK